MNKIVPLLLAAPLTVFAEPDSGFPNTYGFGAGVEYGGLGFNLARVSDRDMKYVSLGWIGINDEDENVFGFSLGWIRTDLFDMDSNRHGFGISLGQIGYEEYFEPVGNDRYVERKRNILGISLGYTYFGNGIDRPGMRYGISWVETDAKSVPDSGIAFSIGYRF